MPPRRFALMLATAFAADALVVGAVGALIVIAALVAYRVAGLL